MRHFYKNKATNRENINSEKNARQILLQTSNCYKEFEFDSVPQLHLQKRVFIV